MSRFRRMLGFALVGLIGLIGLIALPWTASPCLGEESTWYKGNTHCHSFWSDGDEFPEMVADWYKSHHYHFLAISDHNILKRGDKWYDVFDKKRPISEAVMAKCRKRFGPDWIETRGQGEKLQVRLKTLEEFRGRLEEPGKFLLIEAEEITGKSQEEFQVHMNAVHLGEVIPHVSEPTVVETLRVNLRAVQEQAARLQRPIFAYVNHPNWPSYHITAEDLAGAIEARAFEVCNASPKVNRLGDAQHPSTDRLWDIANTLRIAERKQPPLWGMATDDAHHYQVFASGKANPGRGFVMVRATELSAEALVEAMNRGDFYASTGVMLRQIAFDKAKNTLMLEVQAEPGVHYTIEFVGTLDDYDRTTRLVTFPPDKEGKPQRAVTQYSPDVGKLLARVQGTRATYQLTGKELYVRAHVVSDRKMANPPEREGQFQEAWTQPVGWQKWLSTTR